MPTPPRAGQSAASARANSDYFLNNIREYERHRREIDTYQILHAYVSAKTRGATTLLDVGNGGVFGYDTTTVGEITALDLFLESLPQEELDRYIPTNARVKQGSALAMPFSDNQFEMVVIVSLLHHLTARDWKSSWNNARTAIAESARVLRPGGRLLIVESCVAPWFFALEKPAFWVLTRSVNTVLSHPVTLQFTPRMIEQEVSSRLTSVRCERIPGGRHVLQFGIKVPSFITPARLYAFEAQKAG